MHPPIGFGRGTLFVRTDDMFTTRGENDLSKQFIFNEDQEQFRDNLARFLADKSKTTEVRAQMADARGCDPAVWSLLNQQLGLGGIAIAEQYGGAGFGPQELAIACEEMGRSLYCGPYFASAVCAAHALSATGGEVHNNSGSRELPAVI